MAQSTLSYAFSYGFLGGPLNSQRFRKLLHEKGYTPASSLIEADIIIAHSAGCWMIPRSVSPKLLLLVGMPMDNNKPFQTLKAANWEKLRALESDRHLLKGITMTLLYSTYYGLTQPKRNRSIARDAKKAHPATKYSSIKTVFIANKNDPWPNVEKVKELFYPYGWAFLGLRGTHDDIWEHPGHYVSIISHYSK